ncbi:MAG TPA: hypothetical protein VGL72_04725 [Bryobacteraceae bacterium]|jgi:hypothetical protein
MKSSTSTHLKNALSITALLLSLAALQCPLWGPAVEHITAKSGGTADVIYGRQLEKAMVFKKGTATLSAPAPGHLMIHGHAPGRTSLLIFYRNGQSTIYEVEVLPG